MVLFLTEASPEIGYGRLLRCTILAQQLKRKQPVLFLLRPDPAAAKLLDSKNLPRSGVQWPVEGSRPRFLILDSRDLGKEQATVLDACRQAGVPMLGVRESPGEAPGLGAILDLTLPPSESGGHSGPDWAILHPRFRHFHRVARKHRSRIRSLFLFFGGSPEYRLVRQWVDWPWRHSLRLKIAADFLLKKAHRRILKRLYPQLHTVGRVECLARSLFSADVALITPGTVALEAAACGTPALYLSRDDRQLQAARWLEERGAGISLGLLGQTEEESFRQALQRLDPETRRAMGQAGKALVDGRGLFRLLEWLGPLGLHPEND